MADLGIRVIRIYTLHPPAFYDELAAWNRGAPGFPVLPRAGRLPARRDVHRGGPDALHAGGRRRLRRGARRPSRPPSTATCTRPPQAGRVVGHLAHGRVAVAPELDRRRRVGPGRHRPHRCAARRGSAPYEPGPVLPRDRRRDATPSAGSPATSTPWRGGARARQLSVPIAFVNWPTTDPLEHPEEPLPEEDLVGVDAEHVLPTDAWPGGTFASFHAYPYYPDFQRHEPGLQVETDGRVDPYAAYLRALKDHFVSMPLMVTEFGVPSSLGAAHLGPLGRDQGTHTEQEAMRIDAELMRLMQRPGRQRGVRLLLVRRVVQADLEHAGEPGRRASPALARPADQRAVVRGARHGLRPGAGRRPRAGTGARARWSTCSPAATRRTSTWT